MYIGNGGCGDVSVCTDCGFGDKCGCCDLGRKVIAVENPLQAAMLEAVAARIRNRENPEQAAVTEAIVQDWRFGVADSVNRAVEASQERRLAALNPQGRTLSQDEIDSINETYDKIAETYRSVLKPVRR